MTKPSLHLHEHRPGTPLPAELKAQLAGSFGGAAAGYHRFRPGYPEPAVRAAIGTDPGHVLDLGAGTGKLAAAVQGLPDAGVVELTAVEPDPQMVDQLRAALPGIHALTGSAEQIPLPDGSTDVIVVGQAMHWFDLDRALPEAARVLRAGGRLAALWNVHDPAHPFTAAFEAELDRHVRPQGGATGRSTPAPPEPPFSGRAEFTDPALQRFRWTRPIDAAGLNGLVDTLSYVITAADDRRAALHSGLDALVAGWTGPVELAETCEVWVATRR
ncbi:class I SAM-dependent methyltransferase [Nakamurella lactea]|uniref:class I SAM-dependent methyltransferase n=1 Tax=Nakamurella lactea TaxID=459515 RepID=UPI000401B787|nr:class I SAM-dependent methyltransferase [Nakamurella lactea]